MSIPPSPRLLILETSGRPGLVALALGDQLHGVHILDDSRRHARDLAPAVAELLTAQEWRARDLDGVLVGRGPGSYTGLRVGIMSAKAFAYATSRALIGVDTFAVLATQAPAEVGRVDVLADAQQDKVYAQTFAREGEMWRAETELRIVPFAEWLAGRRSEAWVTGPGLKKWQDQLPAEVPRVNPTLWDPHAESLLAVGLARYRAGERDDPWSLEPLYLRPSSAEERWQERRPADR
jgi:tRNA threonylcarbamoyladenosine biosynthesis protein TsaB